MSIECKCCIWKKQALMFALILFALVLTFNVIGIVVTIQRMGFYAFAGSLDIAKQDISSQDSVSVPSKTVKVLASAYSSTIDQTDATPCLTANGYNVCSFYDKYGEGETVAANFLPMNSVIKIPSLYGEKFFVVRDRMNSRYGYGRMDIWMPTRSEALVFGKRWVEVEVYE